MSRCPMNRSADEKMIDGPMTRWADALCCARRRQHAYELWPVGGLRRFRRRRRCSGHPGGRAGQQDSVHRHETEEWTASDHLRRSLRAGVLDRRQLQRRVSRRAQRTDRVRAPVRAHDVQGIRECRARRASLSNVHVRRRHERDDQQRQDALLRSAAVESARHGSLPRS